jgi:hypothetical protein
MSDVYAHTPYGELKVGRLVDLKVYENGRVMGSLQAGGLNIRGPVAVIDPEPTPASVNYAKGVVDQDRRILLKCLDDQPMVGREGCFFWSYTGAEVPDDEIARLKGLEKLELVKFGKVAVKMELKDGVRITTKGKYVVNENLAATQG